MQITALSSVYRQLVPCTQQGGTGEDLYQQSDHVQRIPASGAGPHAELPLLNFDLTAHLRWALIARKLESTSSSIVARRVRPFSRQRISLHRRQPAVRVIGVYPELQFIQYAATDNIHAAAQEGDPTSEAAVKKLLPPPGGDIFVLRPAPQQLDNINTV